MDDFWHWLNYTAVPSLRSDNWYNNKRPVGMRGFLGDTVSRLMGFATLRQLRVKKGLLFQCLFFLQLFDDIYREP